MMNRVLVPFGTKENYTPLNRELFWNVENQTLYIWYDKWIPIAGDYKQFLMKAGDNLEIVYRDDDLEKLYPILRLKDDIDINTMTLGKNSNTARWKGTVKIGEVKDTTFFPVVNYSAGSKDVVGGEFLIKITRGDDIEYGLYHSTLTGCGSMCSNFGSDDKNVKCTVNKITYIDGTTAIGFRTFSSLRKKTTYEEITGEEGLHTRDIYFVINSKDDIYFQDSDGEKVKFTNRFDIISTGTDSDADSYGCHWYEMSMSDFRRITGIPLTTGSNLDQYDNNSYVYFDIYINDQSQFSIDRAFITHTRADTGEDDIVSDGKIWCHNPYWMTPNDKSVVDVSDGFEFLDNVFDDSSNNLDYTPGSPIKIMSVYMVIPGQTTTVTHTELLYLPPDKIEVWFNGWNIRESDPSFEKVESDISSSIVVARD